MIQGTEQKQINEGIALQFITIYLYINLNIVSSGRIWSYQRSITQPEYKKSFPFHDYLWSQGYNRLCLQHVETPVMWRTELQAIYYRSATQGGVKPTRGGPQLIHTSWLYWHGSVHEIFQHVPPCNLFFWFYELVPERVGNTFCKIRCDELAASVHHRNTAAGITAVLWRYLVFQMQLKKEKRKTSNKRLIIL